MNSVKDARPSARQYPYFPLMVLIHGCSVLMDSAVTVILASSALFTVNVDQARLSILFSLLGTMAPFILLAPSATYLVEKIRTPRITVAIVINALRFIGLVLMALASAHSSTTRLAIFPLAFVMLTLSKCYAVAKTSSLPQITTTASFPYFSSRLSMTTGIVSVTVGSLLFAINRIFSESTTLYFAAFVAFMLIGLSVISYIHLHRKIAIHGGDDSQNNTAIESDSEFVDISIQHRARAIKSLFTFACAIRFAVGALTIAIGLRFRSDELILASCFFSAAVSSFVTNAVAVILNRLRIAPIINYIVLGAFLGCGALLVVSSSSIVFIVISGVLGSAAAYTRVAYESRAAHIIPTDISARILSRGEVWMQLSWVVGSVCAVISYKPVVIGTLCVAATVLSLYAYSSTITALKAK